MEITIDGDDHLSGFDKKMWQLVYYCLLKFQCPVLYKHHRGSPKDKIDAYVEFFVPVQHPKSHEIVQFLEYELEDEHMPGTVSNCCGHEYYSPGRTVIIRQFSEMGMYCERDVWEELSKNAMDHFIQLIQEKKKGKQ